MLLNINQLGEYLGVSTNTIYKWVSQNKIPFVKLPNRNVRFDQAKIDRWLKVRSASTNVAGIQI